MKNSGTLPLPVIRRPQKLELLRWFFSTFEDLQLHTWDSFTTALLDSPYASLAEGVSTMDTRLLAYTILGRMARTAKKAQWFKREFSDCYISLCGWQTFELATPGVVPEELQRYPGGAHPKRKLRDGEVGEGGRTTITRYKEWEFPTGVKWGPVSYFTTGAGSDTCRDYEDLDSFVDEAVDDLDVFCPSAVESPTARAFLDRSTQFDLLVSGMRGVQWERAKGELRAAVKSVGCTTVSRDVGDKEVQKWEEFEQRVEDFIRGIERDGLHE